MDSWATKASSGAAAPASLRLRGSRGSAVGVGLAALGRPGYINLGRAQDLGPDRSREALGARASTVLDTAYAAGARYFDLARSYGDAELFMADWLERRGLAPGEVGVGSKWGYSYTAGWQVRAERHEVKDLSVGQLRRQLAESRNLLGSHLSLYQIHSATLESGVLADREVIEELAALRASGVAVGLSVSGPGQAATIDAAVELGAFDTVQATWNLLEPSAGASLARAHDAGLGVIVKEPLANGLLSARGGHPGLADLGRRTGHSPERIAFAAALSRPWADVVLSGAVTAEQLAGNLAAASLPWDVDLDRAALELAIPTDRYWSQRAALPWN